MAISQDLINFDLIESHKENIQALPQGRSARQLASVLSPPPISRGGVLPTFEDTKTLNDAIRQEYEIELQSINDSDDPLDIYDRYVKWTLNAYPSAQATPQSQLLPLLERATKSFLTSTHYKNDPRYLKLWLHYIRLFSDAPRETFAFLARHQIGEGLGLFYEEFAAWLENASRWTQAEEVYQLGVERGARPAERLMRKYNQFQKRYEARAPNANEPTSPALPTVRPALATKIDPFASTPRSDDPQAPPARGAVSAGGASRSGKPKMAIFSDVGSGTPPKIAPAGKGWDNIGSVRDRKKENTIEARPWTGETLKAGKKMVGEPKMAIFKDSTLRENQHTSDHLSRQKTRAANPCASRSERVFVSLEAVYPNENEEYSFEELRAKRRGWADRRWHQEQSNPLQPIPGNVQHSPVARSSSPAQGIENLSIDFQQKANVEDVDYVPGDPSGDTKPPKQKRIKVREVKQETQTVKTRLESPTGPKIKRKNSAEPTMTFHSKAATDEIYDIFNQPVKQEVKDDTQSGDDTDFGDDDCSTAGESTGTGRISGTTSEYGEDDTMASIRADENTRTGNQLESVSPWSDFTVSKHVPKSKHKARQTESEDLTGNISSSQNQTQTTGFDTQAIAAIANQDFGDMDTKVIAALAGAHDDEDEEEQTEDLQTPAEATLPEHVEIPNKPHYVPLPPEDYEPTPLRPFRDLSELAQHRLPFMTPIVEKTESSLAPSTAFAETDYFNSKTPSRSALAPMAKTESPSKLKVDALLLSSPQKESPTPAKRKLLKSGATEDELLISSPQKKIAPSSAQFAPKINFGVTKPTATSSNGTLFKTPAIPSSKANGTIIKDLQCNPCDTAIRMQILHSVHPPLSSEPGYFDNSRSDYKCYPHLQSYAQRAANHKFKSSPRKSQSEKTVTKSQAPVLDFSGTTRVYAVKRLLGKGAYAPVYLVDSFDADEHTDTQKATSYDSANIRGCLEAIKTDSPPQNSAWEFHILCLLRRRLGHASRAMQSVVLARECHLFKDECYLVLDYHCQGTLLDLANKWQAENKRTGKGGDCGVDEVLAMWFSVELLRTITEVHKVGVLHGDMKADNCLVRFDPKVEITGGYDPEGKDGWSGRGMTLIDFGRGIDMRCFEEKTRFVADWDADGQDCVEIRECRPWRSEIDWFGCAGVLHSLLFGKYIETVPVTGAGGGDFGLGGGGLGRKKEWKLKEGFKRYWQGGLWGEVFHTLINSGLVEGGEDGIRRKVAGLRTRMEDWLVEFGEREGRDLRKCLRRAEGVVGMRK